MNYHELCGLLMHANIVLLYDHKYTYEFHKTIRGGKVCIKMIKYKGSIFDNNKIYGFVETMHDNPTKEITKILDSTKLLTVIKVGV